MMKLTRVILLLAVLTVASGGILAESVSPITMATDQPAPAGSLNIAGSELRLLPANIDIWSCDWTPDGKALVFSGKLQGEPATKMRIWYWTLDPAKTPIPLSNSDGLIEFSPRWAPDGTKIVLMRRAINASNNVTSTVWIKEVPGGSSRQLTNGPQDRDPFWSPDGKQIVFSRGQGPYRAKLMIANAADGLCRTLVGNGNELLQSPWWGVNGKIYFTKLTPAQKNVTVNGRNYQVMDYGRGSIWAINPVNQALELVVGDEFDNRLPALSPDGEKLAFVSNRPTKDGNGKFDRGSLFIKDLTTGQITYVTNQVGLNGGSLTWSPDGKKLAFFTFRSIRPAVWVINIP